MPGYICRTCKKPFFLSPAVMPEGLEDITGYFTTGTATFEVSNIDPYNLPEAKQICYWCFKDLPKEEKDIYFGL